MKIKISKPKHQKETPKSKNTKKSNLKVGLNRRPKEGEKVEGGLKYNTTLIDRLSKKISFESLDINSNFSIHEDTAFAKGGYIKVYNIVKYPQEVAYSEDRGFLSSILNSMKNIKGIGDEVDFFYESYNLPYHVRFDQNAKRRYAGLERLERTLTEQMQETGNKHNSARDREIKQVASDVLEFRLTEVIKKKNSYNIIRNNQNKGRTQIETYQFIRMVSKKKSLLSVAEDQLKARLSSLDIQIRVVKDLTSYYETFSPVSGLYNLNKSGEYASTVFTSSGYSKIRNKPTRVMENELEGLSRLIYVGTDIETFEPLGLSFTSGGQGQNILIAGATGSGKTYLYENLMKNAALNKFKINAMDYKGGEYDVMAEIIPNSIILDFSMNSPKFINTLKFMPSLYERADWKGAFSANIEATVTSLRVLSGVSEENVKVAENALEDMIKTLYAKNHQVHFEDEDSYYRTRNVDYFREIGEGITKFQSEQVLKDVFGEEVCRQLYSGLFPYFSTTSHRSYMFSEEIDLEEVLTKDCIIYSFNMNKESLWSTQVEYKILNQDYVANLFIQKNKKEGYTTLNSLEEYQRAVNYPDMRTIYNNKFSGGRSDNVINVVLTNTIRPFLEKSNDISAIRENISTIMIGRLQDMDALDDFCRTFGVDIGGRSKIMKLQNYKHVFYSKYNTGNQRGERLIKAIHPQHVSASLETKRIDRKGEF